jgi:hypothetical protein
MDGATGTGGCNDAYLTTAAVLIFVTRSIEQRHKAQHAATVPA